MNRSSSIRKKLVVVVMATTFAALLVSVGLIIGYDLRNYHRSLVNDMSTQAELVGHMTSAALAFDDTRLAGENLALLRTRPMVGAAAIYDENGRLFASYSARKASRRLPGAPGSGRHARRRHSTCRCSGRSWKTAKPSARSGCAPRTGCWRARSITWPSRSA